MIKPVCDRCKKELDEFGASLFSSPHTDAVGSQYVSKFHICNKCFYGFGGLWDWFESVRK